MLAVIENYIRKVKEGEVSPTDIQVMPLVEALSSRMNTLSLYEVSEAFWMLTLLLWLKLRYLIPVYLPVEEEEEEEIEGEAYYDYSSIVEALKRRIEERGDFFEFNIHQEFEPEIELDLYSLSRAYANDFYRRPKIKYVPDKITFEGVLEEFKTLLEFRRRFVLQEHFKGREKLSMAFFVSLELYRLMEILLEQDAPFSPLLVEKIYRVLPPSYGSLSTGGDARMDREQGIEDKGNMVGFGEMGEGESGMDSKIEKGNLPPEEGEHERKGS